MLHWYIILLLFNLVAVGVGLYKGDMDWVYTGNAIAVGMCLEYILQWLKPDNKPVIVLEVCEYNDDEKGEN